MKFAKAVYCAGVDAWYIRLGSQHGIDVMFKQPLGAIARLRADLINKSLNRDILKNSKRKKKCPRGLNIPHQQKEKT
jgi:hypothetical protein